MRKGNSDPLPPDLAAELAALEAMSDETIDTTEMPAAADWTGAQRGRFYKPKKLQRTLRIDADVLAWFEARGPGHLTRMNRVLRATMLMEIQRKTKAEPTGDQVVAETAELPKVPGIAKWRQSVIRVGNGRGFVMADDQENLVVVTAAHCLPHLPPAHGGSYPEERTYAGLLGPLGDEPSISAEVLFVDPVADIAVLGPPDNQETEAFDALVEAAEPLSSAALEFRRESYTVGGQVMLGRPEAEADAWLLGLDGEWFSCRVRSRRVRAGGIWIERATKPIVGGMSGSPILVQSGVIGIVGLSAGTDDDAHHEGGPQAYLPLALPGWMLGRVPLLLNRRPGIAALG